MIKIICKILLLFISIYSLTPAQAAEEVKLKVDSNFDIRKVSMTYFSDPDLWQYILIYNKINSLSDLKPGTVILIPKTKVVSALSKLADAKKNIEEAVNYGAKILAEDLLNKAVALNKEANQYKLKFDFDKSAQLADESISYSKQAYSQTKGIRDKTIDAIISFKKGTVQKMFPSILKWQNAEEMENLKENDWARTLAFSLAKITFFDLSQIKLGENSQAVIQRSRSDALSNKSDTKVKLEKGDAYAMLLSNPKKKFDLEIKGVKTKINSKYFWVEKGADGAKVANYNGEIKIEVKDSAVVVQKNQGTVIRGDNPPSKPKDLLSPPELKLPLDLANLLSPIQEFSWIKVSGAQSYWFDIAIDKKFKSFYESRKDIVNENTIFRGIPKGIYYWRVCSVDSSGLPGPYSDPRYFVVSPDNKRPFLYIDFPVNNFVSKDAKIRLSGKTDTWNKIIVNQKTIDVKGEGFFLHEILLNEGKNKISIKAVNQEGIESEFLRNVFYESDADIKIDELKNGTVENGKKIYIANSSQNLMLYTRPLAKIEIAAKNNKWQRTAFTDTLGNCTIVLPVINKSELVFLTVKSQAGFEKKISIELVKDELTPSIIPDPSIEYITKNNSITLSGKVINAKEFYVNNNKIELKNDGAFYYKLNLTNKFTPLEMKAVGQLGSTSYFERKVILDNIPPKLVSFNIQKLIENKSSFRITVKAEDEFGLRKAALIEFSFGSVIKRESLSFDENLSVYQGFITSESTEIPVLRTVTLQDYMMNAKTYVLSK